MLTSLFGAVYFPIATKERRAEKDEAEEDKEEIIYSLDWSAKVWNVILAGLILFSENLWLRQKRTWATERHIYRVSLSASNLVTLSGSISA